VGTPIDSLRAFDGVARLARTADEWSQALTHSLSEAARSPGAAERRQGVARAHDWSRIVSTIATAMARHLGEAYPERLDAGHSAAQAST
jgi:hypothetical protein